MGLIIKINLKHRINGRIIREVVGIVIVSQKHNKPITKGKLVKRRKGSTVNRTPGSQ